MTLTFGENRLPEKERWCAAWPESPDAPRKARYTRWIRGAMDDVKWRDCAECGGPVTALTHGRAGRDGTVTHEPGEYRGGVFKSACLDWMVAHPVGEKYGPTLEDLLPEPTIDALQACNACDEIGPTHPVTGYCKRCQREAARATRKARVPACVKCRPVIGGPSPRTGHDGPHDWPEPRKTKTTAAPRTPAAPPVMAPATVALDGGKAPCPRCGRSDWRTAAGRTWHLANNPECGKYRRPERHAYATITA